MRRMLPLWWLSLLGSIIAAASSSSSEYAVVDSTMSSSSLRGGGNRVKQLDNGFGSSGISGPCDDSFPVAPSPKSNDAIDGNNNGKDDPRKRRLVAIPYDQASYAPLCDDGKHIDIRQLMRCNSGSCWNEFIEQCTFECMWNPPTVYNSAKPTSKPTRTSSTSTTSNPVLLTLEDLEEVFSISEFTRDKIIEFIKELIERDMQDLEITNIINFAGALPCGSKHAIAMEILASSPSDISDFSLKLILETLRDNEVELKSYIKTLDGGNPYNTLGLNINTYDPNDLICKPTDPPTVSPLEVPPVKFGVAPKVSQVEEEEESPSLWWVWLIVVPLLLLLIFCCIWWFCVKNDDDEKDGNQSINMFMWNNSNTRNPPPKNLSTRNIKSRRSVVSRSGDRRVRTKGSRAKRAATIVSRSFTRDRLPKEDKHTRRITIQTNESQDDVKSTVAFPAMDVVSALPITDGFDPPGDALVPYTSGTAKKPSRDPTMYVDGVGHCDPTMYSDNGTTKKKPSRDPTMYIDNGDTKEPGGDKPSRKKSMFGTDASASGSSRRNPGRKKNFGSLSWKRPLEDPAEEQWDVNAGLKEPDALTSEEVVRGSSRKKKNKKSSSSSRRRTTSTERDDAPLDIYFGMNGASVKTNDPPNGYNKGQGDQYGYYDYDNSGESVMNGASVKTTDPPNGYNKGQGDQYGYNDYDNSGENLRSSGVESVGSYGV